MGLFDWIKNNRKKESNTQEVFTNKVEVKKEENSCSEAAFEHQTEATSTNDSSWKEYAIQKWKEYEIQQEKIKKMPITEQLKLLQAETQECDVIIGTIYIQNPPAVENRYQLKKLFGNALLVEEYGVPGQRDMELNLIFSVGNLLIGVNYFAYWTSSFSMGHECKVYRFSKNQSLKSLDMEKVKKMLFGY